MTLASRTQGPAIPKSQAREADFSTKTLAGMTKRATHPSIPVCPESNHEVPAPFRLLRPRVLALRGGGVGVHHRPGLCRRTGIAGKARRAEGEIVEFTMDSKDSRIYKGIAKDKKGKVPYQRKVAVYIPAQYKAGEEVAVHRRPRRARLPGPATEGARQPDRGKARAGDGRRDDQFRRRRFARQPARPRIRRRGRHLLEVHREARSCRKSARTTISSSPRIRGPRDDGRQLRRGGGIHHGGFHPELYRKVLTYSGTFVDQQFPEDRKNPDGAWEYHKNLIRDPPRNPSASGSTSARRTTAGTATKRRSTTG